MVSFYNIYYTIGMVQKDSLIWKCPDGYTSCGDNRSYGYYEDCFPIDYTCNGNTDCRNRKDEFYCDDQV